MHVGFRSMMSKLFPKIDERALQWSLPPLSNVNPYYSTNPYSTTETTPQDWQGYIDELYKSSPVVFAACQERSKLFSAIRFQWRPIKEVATQFNLFGTTELELLETPWPGGSTADLCARALQDVDLNGNFFAKKEVSLSGQKRLRRFRPDWVTIELTGKPGEDIEVDIDHYMYHAGGIDSGGKTERIEVEDMVHWAPIPDPNSMFLGMSWMTPIIHDVLAGKSATKHMLNFFKKGAQLGIVAMVKDESVSIEDMRMARDEFVSAHRGAENAHEPLFLGPSFDLKVFQNNLKDLDLSSVRAHVEAHITACGGVPSVMLGLAEGQSTSALGQSNYKPAAEGFVDRTMRHLWMSFCEAVSPMVDQPRDKNKKPIQGMRLWYSDADISVLNRDRKEDAEIIAANMTAVMAAVTNGVEFDTAVATVQSGDIKKLKHTNLFSVQLQTLDAMQKDSEVMNTSMKAINEAIKAGATPESAVEAIKANDLSKLVFANPPEPETTGDTEESVEPATEETTE